MSEYLGIQPTTEPKYFFLSYSNKDADKIKNSLLVKKLADNKIPVWYDDGIAAGDLWESEIGRKIKNSICVLFFISKNSFNSDTKSYSFKEYQLSEYYNKEIKIIQIDDIESSDIPDNLVPWWIDISNTQKFMPYNDKEKVETDRIIEFINSKKDVFNRLPEEINEQLLTKQFYKDLNNETRIALMKIVNRCVDNILNIEDRCNNNDLFNRSFNVYLDAAKTHPDIVNPKNSIPENINEVYRQETEKFSKILSNATKFARYKCMENKCGEYKSYLTIFPAKLLNLCAEYVNNKNLMTCIKIILNKYNEIYGSLSKKSLYDIDSHAAFNKWCENIEDQEKYEGNYEKIYNLEFIEEEFVKIHTDIIKIREFASFLWGISLDIVYSS